jgi:hypothetical protein
MRKILHETYFPCFTQEEFDLLVLDSMVVHLLTTLELLSNPVGEGKRRMRILLTRY